MFVNSDKKNLSTVGRNVLLITMDSFKEKIVKRARKVDEFFDDSISDPSRPCDFPDEIMQSLVCNDENIKKDLKFIVDFENLSANKSTVFGTFPNRGNLLGFNETPFGMPYLGCMAGGDWELPLFFIIYYDGKKFRAYMPSYGNVVNLDCKCALGSEEGSDLFESVIEKYENKGWLAPGVKHEGYELMNTYLSQQGFDEDSAVGDWNAILEDIANRFNVVA